MPDNYTHRHTALKAMKNRDFIIPNEEAFVWGANGPDPLFCYNVYGKKGSDIRGFGGRMHNYRTGLFLQNLYRFARTDTQKSYFLGFLCHYGVDTTMHPYVHFYTTHGTEYDIHEGHGYFEAALDRYVALQDGCGTQKLSKLYAPKLTKEEMKEIAIQFQQAVSKTYEVELSTTIIEKAFRDFQLSKGLLNGNGKIFALLERILQMKKGHLTAHIQPAVMELHTKGTWSNRFTQEEVHKTVDDMLVDSIEKCESLLSYGVDLLKNPERITDFSREVGNMGYSTGLELDE